jgi:hypothetical protein
VGKTTEPAKTVEPTSLDERIAEAQKELNEARQSLTDYKGQRAAAGRSLKGGPSKRVRNAKELLWLPRRQEATVKPKSKLGRQIVKEDALINDAAAKKGKLVLHGTDVLTGKPVTVEVGPSKFNSTVVTYDDPGRN